MLIHNCTDLLAEQLDGKVRSAEVQYPKAAHQLLPLLPHANAVQLQDNLQYCNTYSQMLCIANDKDELHLLLC